jgi:hypothetical protein
MMRVGINQMVHEDFQDGPNEHYDVEHEEEDEFRSEHVPSIALYGDLARAGTCVQIPH